MRKNIHHCIPRSRTGKRKIHGNRIMLPGRFHKSWHTVFENLTPNEAKDFIEEVMQQGHKGLSWKQLHTIRETVMSKDTDKIVQICRDCGSEMTVSGKKGKKLFAYCPTLACRSFKKTVVFVWDREWSLYVPRR